MTKTLLTSFAILFTLCAPALAQPAAPVPAPSTAAARLSFELTMQHHQDSRTYQIIMDPEAGCGSLHARDAARSDEVRVCPRTTKRGVLLEVSWKLRAGTVEYETEWDAVVARGETVAVGRAGGVRFTLAMQ